MPILYVSDFRGGLDESTPVEKFPLDSSPSERNSLVLPSGYLTKRRGTNKIASFGLDNIYFTKLLEHSSAVEIIQNWHFDAWTGPNPDNWTVDGSASVALVNPHSIKINTTGPANKGINQTWGVLYSNNARYLNNFTLKAAITADAGKDVIFEVRRGGNLVWQYTYTGTGSQQSISQSLTEIFHTSGDDTGTTFDLFILAEDATTNAIIDWVSLYTATSEIFVFGDDGGVPVTMYSKSGNYKFFNFHGGQVFSAPVFEGSIHAMLQGSDDSNATKNNGPFVIGKTYAYPYADNTNYAPPSSWNAGGVPAKSDLPKFGEVLKIGAKPRLYWGNNRTNPSTLWWHDIRDVFVLNDNVDVGKFRPGAQVVGDISEEIRALKSVAGGLLVFKKSHVYLFTPEGLGHHTTLDAAIGCNWHTAVVRVGNVVFFPSRLGFVAMDGDTLQYQVISDLIQPTFENLDLAQKITGVYHEKRRSITWWAYSNKESGYISLEYRLDNGKWFYANYAALARPSVLSADYSIENEHVFVGIASATGLIRYGKDTDVDDVHVSSYGGAVQAIDFSRKSPVFFLGDFEKNKHWVDLFVWYNGLASVSNYPFTIIIDRNPLGFDYQIPDSARYIRITDIEEIGDGSTWTTISTSSGFSLGNQAGSSLDFNSAISRLLFRYKGIGKARTIQLEFADNRTGTDFIIFNYALVVNKA